MSPHPIAFPIGGLSDGTVRLRLVADADVPAVAAACDDPEIARYTTIPSPYAPRHAREWARQARRGLESGTDLQTVVVAEDGGELLGAVGLNAIDPATGRCAAGYWVAAPARGRGVATRALRLLCRYGFDELGLDRIEAWIDPGNTGSLRVAERLGFAREGLLRSFMPINGIRRDMLMCSLLPGDLR
ncbi:MAG TPA: GNAT family protein [Solirubrobacterales bacterium]|nr:GNAT family protein [Solirubrobacterales bacterium]